MKPQCCRCQFQESCMSDELDPPLARLLQDDDRPDLIGVTLKTFRKSSVIKVLTVYTVPSTSTVGWTVGSDMSLPTVLQKLYSSRKLFVQLLLQLLLRRLKLLGRLLLFNSTVFVRILMYRPNHLLSLWSTILHWQTAC